MYVIPTNKLEKTIKKSGTPEGVLDGLLECVSALKCQERIELEKIIKELKISDGEKWAVGFTEDIKKVEIKRVGIEWNNYSGIKPYLEVITNDPIKGVSTHIEVLASEVQDILKDGTTHVMIKETRRFHKEFVKAV